MKVELNLIKNQGIFIPVYTLISRERFNVDDDNIMTTICQFIRDNASVFDAALSDKELVTKLTTIESISVSELMSLKYCLASAGMDLLVNQVAEEEVNPDSIPEGIAEYNIIDDLDVEQGFVKFSTKVTTDQDTSSMSDVYGKIIEIFDYFSTPLTASCENPLKENMDTLLVTEKSIGRAPESVTTYINSVLEYLGKRIILIQND